MSASCYRMRKLLIVLLVSPAWGIAFVNSGSGVSESAATSVSTGAMNVTTGNLIACGVRLAANVTVTMSDTGGDAFSQAVSVVDAGGDTVIGVYAKNVAGNASDVITASFASTSFVAINCHQYSGADTAAPLDVTGSGDNSAVVSSITSSSFTPTNAGDVAAAFASVAALAQTFTAGSGYTLRVSNDFFGSEDKLNTGTGAQTASMSFSGSGDVQIVVMTFKPAAGGPTCSQSIALMGVGCR